MMEKWIILCESMLIKFLELSPQKMYSLTLCWQLSFQPGNKTEQQNKTKQNSNSSRAILLKRLLKHMTSLCNTELSSLV